jgi:phosphoribosylformylglycinamidine synthase
LITALLESGFNKELGFDVQQSANKVRSDAYWFGEAQSRVMISCTIKNAEALLAELKQLNVPYEYLGIVTEGGIDMEGDYWGHISEWKDLYDNAIERILNPTLGEQMKEPKTSRREIEKEAIKFKGEVKGV